jgi:integrase
MKDWTALEVAKCRTPGTWRVSRNLYLQVEPAGDGQGITKSWICRYMLDGRARSMGLGPSELVSLGEARDRAVAARKLLLDGIDPIEARNAERLQAKLAAASTMTFKECGKAYIAAHETGWRNAKHRQQWRNTLDTYVYPLIGALPVQAIDTALVMKILEPIWTAKPETAGRVRGRIESILDWAKVRQFRSGDNPARWRGHLDKLLPQKRKIHKVRHQPAMPYRDVPAFMAELRRQTSTSARALEFTVLAAVRTGETTGATWPEIDRAAKIWTIPARRIKAERDHRVPLSDRALAILDDLPREKGNDHVFIGGRTGRGLSDMAMLELLRGMAGDSYTVHGFRSSFRDWAAEQTNYPRELAEVELAHALKDKTEAAYQRGDLLEKRRRMMNAWARYGASLAHADGAVVEPRAATMGG